MQEITLDSLAALQQFQDTLQPGKSFCFRGQSNAAWGLVPSMYRGLQDFDPLPDNADDGHWIEEVERDIYREFERCCPPLAGDRWLIGTQWHRLFLAQHYGVPTRLLDWTRNLSVAAYFASTANDEKDIAVWCLNVSDFPHPPALGRLTPNRGHRLEALEACVARSDLRFFTQLSKPAIFGTTTPSSSPPTLPSDQSGNPAWRGFLVILEPPVLEDRMRNQQSLFTLYVPAGDYELVWNHSDYIQRVEAKYSLDLLTKITIPRDAKSKLRQALARSGIDHSHIFPDLTGLAMQLGQSRQEQFAHYVEERKNWTP